MLSRKILTIGILALFLAGALLARPAAVQSAPHPAAQEQKIAELRCAGMDVVFLISQAGSMRVNDVGDLRIAAVRNAISMVVDNALYFCPGFTHRLAVLGFGEMGVNDPVKGYNDRDVAVYIKREIKVPQTGIREWIDGINKEKANIKNEVLNRTEGESRSDVESALNYTYEQVLLPWAKEKIEGPRRKAVIMIGDGNLCTVTNDRCDITTKAWEKYLQSILDIADPRGAKFPYAGFDNDASVHIRYISFTTPDAAGFVFTNNPGIRDFWNQIVNKHGVQKSDAAIRPNELPPADFVLLQQAVGNSEEKRKEANRDVAARVAEVFGGLLGSTLKTWDCTQPIWIEPYRSSVSVFHVFKIRAVDTTQITIRAGNQVLRGGVSTGGSGEVEWESSDTVEKYKIPMAPPGKYEVMVKGGDICKDIVIQIGQSSVTGSAQIPAPGVAYAEEKKEPFYDVNNPVKFRFELRQPRLDGTSEPLKELAGYPIDLKIKVTNPVTKVDITYTLKRVDEKNAIYEATQPLTFRDPGEYKWEMMGVTNDPREVDPVKPNEKTRTQIEILKIGGAYSVLPFDRHFDFSITTPKDSPANDGYALEGADMAPLEVQVQVQVADQAGQPVNSLISSDKKDERPFEAVLINDKGQVVGSQLMTLSPTSANLYTAQFTGSSKDSKRFAFGCYQLSVNLTDNFKGGGYHPKATTKGPIKVCFNEIEKFTWKIVNPVAGKNYELHPQLAFFPPVINLPLEVAVDGQGLVSSADLSQVSKTLFTGTLKDPNGKTYPLSFAPEKVEKGEFSKKFVANWPEKADVEGMYTLTVDVNKDAALFIWTPDNLKTDPVLFMRNDPLPNKPWALLALILLIAFLLLLAFLIWNIVTRPRGSVTLTNLSTRNDLYIPLGRFPGGWWHTNVIRKSQMSEFGLVKITARKAKPTDGGYYDGTNSRPTRAATLAFYRSGNVEDPNSGHFNQGDQVMLDAEVEVKYE